MKKKNNYKKILSKQNQKWFSNFYKKFGRPPHVLHIGNIANNAYNNAKIMNEAGICSDVLCHDYYHIMSNPEWEDADFSKFPGDDFFPDWTKSKIKNFDRPKWFVQGPIRICLMYLLAKKNKKKIESQILWYLLSCFNGTNAVNIFKFLNIINFATLIIKFFVDLIKFFVDLIKSFVIRIAYHFSSLIIIFFSFFIQLVNHIFSIKLLFPKLNLFFFIKLLLFFIKLLFPKLNLNFNSLLKRDNAVKIISLNLIKEYSNEFKNKKLFIKKNVFYYFNFNLLQTFRKVFEHYDFIIAYSTDPIIPMMVKVPYFSFEHGTLRDIPYEQTVRANLTSLAYRKSIHTFVTNFDCIKSANYLTQGRFTIINHPFDEDSHLQDNNYKLARKDLLKKLDSDFLFFHPTRHDWVKGKGFADKDNDKFLNAFINLRSKGFRVGLVACDWGNNVKQSKKILNRFEKHVHWLKPIGSYKFRSMCKTCDIVVDQFKLGSFGGIVFKSLACGSPVLTYLNKKKLKKQYKVIPPVINCRTQKEIEINIKKILLSPKQLKIKRLKSRRWVKKYHGKVETVNKQVNQFRLNY